MKRRIIFLILFILLSSLVIAEFDVRKSYTWIKNEGSQGNYNNDAVSSALAAISLKDFDVDEASEAISWLESNKNTNNCWPKTSCRVKDTALAIWALAEFEEDYNDEVEWLENAETASSLGGNWYLQIVTSGSGECVINYMKGNVEVERTIQVEDGKFPEYGNSNWLNLNSDLEAGLLTRYSSIELDIDCTDISSSTIISLLFNSGNSYYIVDEVHSNQATITIQNSCYGVGYRSGCNFESTLYTSWILTKLNREPKSLFYLEQNFDKNNAVHNSLLYMITQKEKYKSNLEESKRRDGSWNNNIFSTSMAILAIGEQENSTEWLESKQRSDGSWNGNVIDTAITLVGVFFGDLGGFVDTDDEGVCDNDYICEPDRGEDEDNCPDDCLVEEGGEEEDYTGVCIVDGRCEREVGEDYYNCPDDCPYEDEEEEETSDNKSEEETIYDEEEGGSSWGIILVLILLVLIGIGGYIYYTKYYLRKGAKIKEGKLKFDYGSFLGEERNKGELDKKLEESIGNLRKLK